MTIILYLLVCATFIQVFYILYFYARILFYHGPVSPQAATAKVSVIVCAHNELENLKKIVPAILQQQYHDFELIIADDRSTDGSWEYLKEYYGENPRFSCLRVEENKEGKNFKKYALSKAIEAARYDLVLLTDADCMPASIFWMREMVSTLTVGKEIVLGYSPYEYRKGWLNLLIRYETLYTAIQYFSFALLKMPYMGVGRNLLYKKSLFIDNKGFNSHITILGGDDDLFIREVATGTNTAICLVKEGQTFSLPKENYFAWLRQKRRHLSVGTFYHWRPKLLLGIQTGSHLLFYLSLFTFFYQDYKAAFLFLMIRGLVFVVIFTLIARKLGDNYRGWVWLLLPIDIVYIFNYLVITLSLVIYKKIKWS